MRFSATRLATWQECSLEAYYVYEEKLVKAQHAKASFGTIIHAALELYNTNANVDEALEFFRENWHHPEKLGVTPEIWPRGSSYSSLRERGVQIIRAYAEQLKWDERTVVATEHRFLVPFGKHELTGVVDLLEVRKSGKGRELLKIIDYKTTTKQPYVADLATNLQLTTYLYASYQQEFWTGNGPDFPGLANGQWLFETMRDMPRRAIWHHLWTMKEIDAGPRDEGDFERLYRLCVEIDKANELGIHIPRVGEHCSLCPAVNGPCPTRVPTADQLAADPHAWI